MQGTRSILSCASCRQRKLKCDRNQPCSNCVTRNVDCVSPMRSRGRSGMQQTGSNKDLDARILQLERLVATIAERQHDTNLEGTRSSDNNPSSASSQKPPGGGLNVDDAPGIMPGRMMANNNQIVYVSAVHWAAICDEIVKVRESIEQENSAEHHLDLSQTSHGGAPMLLQCMGSSSEVEDILSDIPSRGISDRLVSRCFTSAEHWIAFLHAPSFQRKYTQFWLDPSEASLPWIGLLFGILFTGTFLYVRSQDNVPEGLGNPADIMETFHRRSTECLIMSNYSTAPSSFTLEALLFNIQAEFVRRSRGQVGVWILTSIATRLAMRTGYHRDPEHYPQISPFHGEIRRRLWATISQLDTLTSYQLGLPTMVQEPQCDTRLPGNFFDEDLDPNADELPEPRPETELTPVLYTIAKGRLLSVFRSFFNQVSSVQMTAYEEIMALDQRLLDAHNLVPHRLRLARLEDSLMVPSNLLIRQYNLELVYQKARCILHRHHMTESYKDPKYTYSRESCIEAAMILLRHQAQIFEEVQVGGRLYREKWFLSSLEHNDFLLASMIVCLELKSRLNEDLTESGGVGGSGLLNYSRKDMINALHKARNFWEESSTTSTEALQASTVLSVMLDRVSLRPKVQDNQVSTTSLYSHEATSQGGANRLTGTANTFSDYPAHRDLDLSNEVDALMSQSMENPALDEIGEMLNSPALVNWDLWDAHMQNSGAAMEFEDS